MKHSFNLTHAVCEEIEAQPLRLMSASREAIEDHLWNTMRALPQFSARDLAAAASTDQTGINPENARDYIVALARAGLVAQVGSGKPGHASSVFRLKPSANTGPKPPRVFALRVVYDANRAQVVGLADTRGVRP